MTGVGLRRTLGLAAPEGTACMGEEYADEWPEATNH